MNRHYIREDDDMTHDAIEREFAYDERRARTRVIAIGGLFLVLLLAFCAKEAFAQTCTAGGSTTCFVASRTEGESPMASTLTWNVIGASSCTAGGTGAWSGAIATSGTRGLSGITTAMTLTLDCVAPATGSKAVLSWTPPTRNMDGSTLTNLGGYVIEYGTAAGSLTQTVQLAVPAASAYTVENLAAGTWYFALKARTTGCFPSTTVTCYESDRTAVVSRAVTTTPGGALPRLSVTLTPFTRPQAPTNLSVTEPTAFEIRPGSTGELLASRVGLIAIGTRCYADERVVSGVAYNGVPIALVDFVNWSTQIPLKEAWARCGA